MRPIEAKAISAIRVLSADTVQKANSGHPGMPIGAAPAAYAIWSDMRHDPKHPNWPGRDRFVLSSGHASSLLYSLLHLYGYGLTMEDMQQFRQYGSLTPGHPEYCHTVGVEATTGPLGQGFAMAVGMAIAEAHMAAIFNKEGFNVVDNYTYVLMGDGCMMEGASYEAASLAGTQKLNKLIAIYDSNRITIEGSTDIAFTENVAARFGAMGWQVINVENGEDIVAISLALEEARIEAEKPSLIIVHTDIAHGTLKEGSAGAHGSPLGDDVIADMRKRLGWKNPPFDIPEDVYAHFEALSLRGARARKEYEEMYAGYAEAYPELAAQLESWRKGEVSEDVFSDDEMLAADAPKATRSCGGVVLNRIFAHMPNLFGGSADLGSSNNTELKTSGYFAPDCREGCNIHFGVRELAMACIANGVALYGGLRAYCATFFVFSDYVKPALRLSALMKLPVTYVLTHDSIGVGEDGPTHQPIEQLASLRATPNTYVFRPADQKETAYAYRAALKLNAPSVMALSRQNLPQIEDTSDKAMLGGYILREPKGTPDVILMASGSEVELMYKAADILSVQGYTARLVSMPCMELFREQSEEYQQSVLPASIRARVSIEAGATQPWGAYVGLDGASIGLDHFGASAKGAVLFKEFGFTAENVANAAIEVIKRNR
ncbi:MAG: transketolase [Christensenellaceae bacterium]|nr:transketolase [Christensenellaceae bacterium]